jgi:hypothetical protein
VFTGLEILLNLSQASLVVIWLVSLSLNSKLLRQYIRIHEVRQLFKLIGLGYCLDIEYICISTKLLFGLSFIY